MKQRQDATGTANISAEDFRKLFADIERQVSDVAEGIGQQRRRTVAHPEDQLQRACVEWFRYAHHDFAPLLFHPNNEAYFGHGQSYTQQQRAGARAKAMGVVPGVADLILLVPSADGRFHGLCIEMKTDKGRQSDAQRAWQGIVMANGYDYRICKSLGDFIAFVNGHLGQ